MTAENSSDEAVPPAVLADAARPNEADAATLPSPPISSPTISPTGAVSPRSRFSMSALFFLVTIAAVCSAVATSGAKSIHGDSPRAVVAIAFAIAGGVLAMILMAYSAVAGVRMLVRAFFLGAGAGLVSYLVLWKPPDIRVLIAGCLVLLGYSLIIRLASRPSG